jgi:3-phenylpropionate/trans-cinnamate dioxygenase ferredoxin reductase subunit
MSGIVIVGASHAGVQAAASLRQLGWQDRIILLSAETDYPYHRPPLSKAYLSGDKTEDQLLLRAPDFYREHSIDLRLGERALAIDPSARTVTTGREIIGYDKLVLATGSRARLLALPGSDARGIFTLRSIADARALRDAMMVAQNVVVIGGGFIGLEFASTARKNGKNVIVLEAQPTLLSRSLPTRLGKFIGDYHASHGVIFKFGEAIEGFTADTGSVTGVKLAGGGVLPADLVLVGIGGTAEMEFAQGLALETDAGGIRVDEHGLTSRPDVYALGDVASFKSAYSSAPMRLESVQNAVDQAKAAAAHMTGGSAPLIAVPWFWTDQYDLKVQMAGLARPGTREIVRGDPGAGAFSILQLDGTRLVASFTVNRAADHMASRKLIAERQELDLAKVKDAEIPLMKALASPG